MVTDRTWSTSDTNGAFFTDYDHTDPGDSGGPFFHQSRALGVLFGSASSRNKDTSIPRHLPFILTSMGYSFSGTTLAPGLRINGDDLKSFSAPANVCAYACDTTAQCVAFNHFPQVGGISANLCQLKRTLSGTTSFPGVTSGQK